MFYRADQIVTYRKTSGKVLVCVPCVIE